MVARDWGEGWLGNVVLHQEEFQSGKMGKFWRWVVVIVAQQCDSTECLRTVHQKRLTW